MSSEKQPLSTYNGPQRGAGGRGWDTKSKLVAETNLSFQKVIKTTKYNYLEEEKGRVKLYNVIFLNNHNTNPSTALIVM